MLQTNWNLNVNEKNNPVFFIVMANVAVKGLRKIKPPLTLGGVDFIPAKSKHFDEILKLCTDGFVKAEPHAKALKMCAPGCIPLFENIINNSLQFPYSILLKDMRDGENIGFRLMSVCHNRDPYMNRRMKECETEDDASNIMSELIGSVRSRVFDQFPEINTVLRREITYVSPKAQRIGIARVLLHMNLNFEELRKQGVDGIVSESSSLANHNLLQLNGYACIGTVQKSLYEEHNVKLEEGTSHIQAYFKDIRL